MFYEIKGTKVALRKMDYNDTDLIIRWRNSDYIREHFIYQGYFTKESHENWIKTMIETGKVVKLMIGDMEDNYKAVGSIYIRDIDRTNNKAEYGIFIGEESARGRGIGSEAAALMIQYCFNVIKLHRLFLRVFADNKQAIKSYENAGFVKEANLKEDVYINGKYRDIVLMGIITPFDK